MFRVHVASPPCPCSRLLLLSAGLLSTQPPPCFSLIPPNQIAYHNSKLEEVSQHSLRIQRAATVGDMLEELRRLLPEDAEAKEKPLRLLEVYQVSVCVCGGGGGGGVGVCVCVGGGGGGGSSWEGWGGVGSTLPPSVLPQQKQS